MRAVLNASPLILLCNTGLSFILPALFQEIVVPDAVWQEIVEGSHLDLAAQMLPDLDYLTRQTVQVVPDVLMLI
jgi:predicted nucleic acid-binding protein